MSTRVIDARPWEAAALVADRYRDGRVFLVGDSAHVMPPTGGFGGNTGIADAYNLAWKVAAVLNGAASAPLLDTYDAERRPVADATVAQALARLQAWFKDPSKKLPPPVPIVPDEHVIFGYRYYSGDTFENPREPSAQPGARAPQLLVEQDGRQQSTIDLFAGRWTLLTGPRDDTWRALAARHPDAQTLHLSSYRIADRDLPRYKMNANGAVLIRPDGFIAWRCEDAGEGAQDSLGQALAEATGQSANRAV